MTEHANAALLRRALREGFQKGNFAVLTETFTSDITWHDGGDNPKLSGTYAGREEVFGLFGRLMELTGGTFRVEDRDILASDEHAVLIARASGERDGRTLAVENDIVVMSVRDGKLAEAYHAIVEQPAWDEFWS